MSPLYKLLVTGDRDWHDIAAVERVLAEYKRIYQGKEILVIHGGAAGADIIAGLCATRLNMHVATIPALWETRRKGAGPQRNAIMVALAPHQGIAFHKDLKKSRGTKDCVRRMRDCNIPVKVVEA